MATELLPEMTRANVDWLREAIRQGALREQDRGDLAHICGIIVGLFESNLARLDEDLRHGVEPGRLLPLAERVLSAADNALQAFDLIGQQADGPLSALADLSSRVRAVRERYAEVAALSRVEPPPVPEEVLAAAEAGPFIRLDELRKRTRQG
jgi:hypothetical protein